MKKVIIITGLVVVSVAVLLESGMLDSLVAFLLVGAVPGTNYTIPSTFMLLAIISAAWLILFRLTVVEALQITAPKRAVKKKRVAQKKRLPKRRYSQV